MTQIKQLLCGFFHGHDWLFRYAAYYGSDVTRHHTCTRCGAKKIEKRLRKPKEWPR